MKSSVKRSTSARKKLKKFRHVEKEEKRTDRASLGNTILNRNFPGCVAKDSDLSCPIP